MKEEEALMVLDNILSTPAQKTIARIILGMPEEEAMKMEEEAEDECLKTLEEAEYETSKCPKCGCTEIDLQLGINRNESGEIDDVDYDPICVKCGYSLGDDWYDEKEIKCIRVGDELEAEA